MEPKLNFSPASLQILNVCLAIIMFGVALAIKPEHFYQLRHQKKALFTGLASQYILLPSVTVLLIMLIKPSPGIALGMLLVAACPGGNVSNFFTMLARGNVALSVTLTAITSLLAFIITPASFLFWASLLPGISGQLNELQISFVDLLLNMMGILLLPLIAGMAVNYWFPHAAEKIAKPARILSILILISFILVTLYFNAQAFRDYILLIFWIVMLHNGLALFGGYGLSYLLGNRQDIHRCVAIETGIQNSGLALVLIFTFFNGNGYMALIAAWWGVWHLVSGFAFAYAFQRKPVQQIA
ncbi:MAG: bile acid:sodium symporter family protein [Cyclobacteriaceae bacterium]|nr:bile acid:sodium symporter family protein [Cyclobacteriaceae bacterium]